LIERTLLSLPLCLVFLAGCADETASSSLAPAQEPAPTVVPTLGGDGAGAEADDPLPGSLPTFDDVAEVDEIDVEAQAAQGAGVRYRARYIEGYPGLLEFKIGNTGSGWQEKFLLQLPTQMPAGPAPLLVVFHKYSTSHFDVLNTTFHQESQQRGWYLLAPLGARQRHFGNSESQINTRAALDLVARLFPIDRARVYGVGFSMGGGALATYTSRHQDPNEIRFAAICQHTGTISLEHVHFWEPDDNDLDDDVPLPGMNLESPDVLEDLFGGTPVQQPFRYRRNSALPLDPLSATPQPDVDLVRNMTHVPTLSWVADSDPLPHLVAQTMAFHAHLGPLNPANRLRVVGSNLHSWTTLDETYVCDWLASHSLHEPTSGSVLADEDGQWFHFQVEQEVSGDFTPFTWSVDATTRTIHVTATTNLERLTIDTPRLGLTLSGTLTVRHSAGDGSGDVLRLLGAELPPTQVLRDGVPASVAYDALTRSVEFLEPHGALHQWVLTFP
jgi:hypothetical protein